MELLTAVMLLLSTEDLAGMPDAMIVDARPLAAYAAGHIPGALHLDPAALSEERGGVQGLLKPLDQLDTLLSEAGLDPTRHVVVYSAMDTPDDLKNAARLFWILEYLGFGRVSVLDGGFAKWKAEGRPIETDAPPAKQERMKLDLTPRPERLATRDEVLGIIKSGAGTLADLRPSEEYAGLSKKDFVQRAGHIPGACSLPAGDAVQNSGTESAPVFTLKPAADLKASIEGANKAPVITYCNTGRDASVGYFLYRLNGYDDVAVYDGAMAEWGNHPALDVAGK